MYGIILASETYIVLLGNTEFWIGSDRKPTDNDIRWVEERIFL